MGEAIVITSGKGGVGKSTVAANLGASLFRLGKSVVLIDGDTGLRSLDVMMGLENQVVYDLCDVVEGVCRLKQALVRDREHGGPALIAAAHTRESGAVTPAQMARLIEKLRPMADFILIDSPAGIGRGFRAAAEAADRGILVATPDPIALRAAERMIGLLSQRDIWHPMLALNRVLPEHERADAPMGIAAFSEGLGLEQLGAIPEDASIARAALSGRPVAYLDKAPSGAAFMRMARRLTGEDVPVRPLYRRGFWARYFPKTIGMHYATRNQY